MKLDRLLSDAFSGGVLRRRELRLTAEEAVYITQTYSADLCPMGDGWYEITFKGTK